MGHRVLLLTWSDFLFQDTQSCAGAIQCQHPVPITPRPTVIFRDEYVREKQQRRAALVAGST